MRQRGGERRAAPSGGMEPRIGVRRERARQRGGSAPRRRPRPAPLGSAPLRGRAALPPSLPCRRSANKVGGKGSGGMGAQRDRRWGALHLLGWGQGGVGLLRQRDTPVPATSRGLSARRGYLDRPRGTRERCPAWERFRPGERTARPPAPNLFISPWLLRAGRTARCAAQSAGQPHRAELGHAGRSQTGQGIESPVPALSVFSRLPLGPEMILGLSSPPPIGWSCRIIMITS